MKRTVLIAQDRVLRCDSTGKRGQMELHMTMRTYGISQNSQARGQAALDRINRTEG
jgi:hypothetical protein